MYAENLILVIFIFIFKDVDSKKLGLPEVYVDPERFRKVREACRKHFRIISCKITSMVTSYDQKTKKVNEY